MHTAPKAIESRDAAGLCVVKDQFVFAIGGVDYLRNKINNGLKSSVEMLDVSSSFLCWIPKVHMLGSRKCFGVGVLNNCIYAIGGVGYVRRRNRYLKSVEVFNLDTQQWKKVSSMSSSRIAFGVGVLNNLIYAVGGTDDDSCLKSVECYDPRLDKWNPVAKMSTGRENVRVGVLDGVMYAIGGTDGSYYLKSVEAYNPITGVWSSIADMHLCRENPGVVALDGLLYVFGGSTNISRYDNSDTVEIYNPKTNSWAMKTISITNMNIMNYIYEAVVVNRPPHLQTN
uniref:Ring canal kelch n=1 Tax=Schizaphis graminum TaxID=13262 RepID=A0A2S2NAH7_SCHGA